MLLDKYHNSALLPVDAEKLLDYGAEVSPDHDSDGSDNTIILQKEIENSICENEGMQ